MSLSIWANPTYSTIYTKQKCLHVCLWCLCVLFKLSWVMTWTCFCRWYTADLQVSFHVWITSFFLSPTVWICRFDAPLVPPVDVGGTYLCLRTSNFLSTPRYDFFDTFIMFWLLFWYQNNFELRFIVHRNRSNSRCNHYLKGPERHKRLFMLHKLISTSFQCFIKRFRNTHPTDATTFLGFCAFGVPQSQYFVLIRATFNSK